MAEYMKELLERERKQQQQELDDHDIRKWPASEVEKLFDI